jgi:modulator of FtsH protease HflC
VVVPNERPVADLLKGAGAVGQSRDTDATPNRRSIARLAAVMGIAALVVGMSRLCVFVVDGTEYAIVTDFGNPTQVVRSPGLGFIYPYQSVRSIDRQVFVYASPSSEFLTLEETPVVAAGTVLWRVADPRRYIETVFDRAGGESRLGDILFAELGATLGRNPLTTFFSVDTVTYRVNAIVAGMTQLCPDAAPLGGRGRGPQRAGSSWGGESTNRCAATEISQQRRGEGGGEAARIYADALGRAPEFYAFLRTMEALRNVVHKGTTRVSPADSALFALLFDSNYFNNAAVEGGDPAEALKK